MKNLRIKLTFIFAASVILLARLPASAAGIVGKRSPKINVQSWITPNPPPTDALEDRVYVVSFWATWCPPCRKSIPGIIKLTDKYRDKDVLFIGFARDKTAAPVRDFVRRTNINYHIAMDNGIGGRFPFRGIPTVFVVGHTGRVAWQGNPMSSAFEAAIIKALESAPPPFLSGIELGPFERLRLQLSGGGGFAAAYHRLKLEAEKKDSENSRLAAEIIKQIDSRIDTRISRAEALRANDLPMAFLLYQRITENYRGSEAAKPAIAVYNELKNNQQVQNEVKAAEALDRAEQILTRCKGCQSCCDFNRKCAQCIWLNEALVGWAKKISTTICSNYKDTQAAQTAQQMLEGLGGRAPQPQQQKENQK